MPFHVAAYTVNAGVNDVNVDTTAVTDSVFTTRNSHIIFTEQYQLIAAFWSGVSALRLRLNMPSLNAISRHQVYPINLSATIPTPPSIQDLREQPLMLPQNEEMAWEESGNLGAGNERENGLFFLQPIGDTYNRPAGLYEIWARFTFTIVVSANSWSGLNVLTASDGLKGGWYAVIGAQCVGASDLFFRIFFPRAPYTARPQGFRQYRPGGICQNAFSGVPWEPQNGALGGLGTWGYFHSFELPQAEIFALAAGATTLELRMRLLYLGDAGSGQPPAYVL
jgi:hypothetical protein